MQVFDEDQRHDVSGRVAAIIRWLIKRAGQVNMPERVKLEFNCAGRRVSASQTVRDGEELMVR